MKAEDFIANLEVDTHDIQAQDQEMHEREEEKSNERLELSVELGVVSSEYGFY